MVCRQLAQTYITQISKTRWLKVFQEGSRKSSMPVLQFGGLKLSKKPKYWDSWKGKVLRAIVYEKAETWNEVRDKSDLTHKQMLKVIKELRKSGTIDYSEVNGEKRFQILDDALYRTYQSAKDGIHIASQKPTQEHVEWIQKWIDTNEVNASLDNLHFFIEGSNLSEITKRLLERAKRSILVVNPFVEGHMLGTSLRDAAKRNVEILLVTRRPQKDPKRWDFHKTLTSEGVDMYYSGGRGGAGGAHSKLVIVDEEVAIVSSMNFTMNSEVDTWETGIVSISKDVVISAAESIRVIKDENETKSADELHRRG